MRVCVIPARGGSVRIPRKNVAPFRGVPMIKWAIQSARKSGLFDNILVTTDDDEIAKAAIGCRIHRREPDDGKAGTQEVAQWALLEMLGNVDKVERVCVLYPCSPLLTPALLTEGLDALDAAQPWAHYAMSVYPDRLQDAGCYYWCKTQPFISGYPLHSKRTVIVPLPAERCIDINTPDDWARAEQMFDALHST